MAHCYSLNICHNNVSFSGSTRPIANLELLPSFLGLGVTDSGETLEQYLPFFSSSSAWPGALCAAGDSSSCYLYQKSTRGNCWQGLKAHAVPSLLISWHLWWLWGSKAPSLKTANCSSCFQARLEVQEPGFASAADTESKSKPLGSELGSHSPWESLVLPLCCLIFCAKLCLPVMKALMPVYTASRFLLPAAGAQIRACISLTLLCTPS